MTAGILTILMTILIVNPSYPQVNTEKFRKESEETGFSGNVSLSAGLASGNSDFVKVNSGLRIDYAGNGYAFFVVGNYEFEEANEAKVVHKGFAHLRNIIKLQKEYYLELFVQKEFNEFILLEDRNLAGAGLRINLPELFCDSVSTPFQVFAGIGFMYENEQYNIPSSQETNLVRSTNYLTFKWQINATLSFISINYFQFDINKFHDYRFMTDTSLNFLILKNLSFNSAVSFRHDNEPVPDVKKYDLEFMNGLTFGF